MKIAYTVASSEPTNNPFLACNVTPEAARTAIERMRRIKEKIWP